MKAIFVLCISLVLFSATGAVANVKRINAFAVPPMPHSLPPTPLYNCGVARAMPSDDVRTPYRVSPKILSLKEAMGIVRKLQAQPSIYVFWVECETG